MRVQKMSVSTFLTTVEIMQINMKYFIKRFKIKNELKKFSFKNLSIVVTHFVPFPFYFINEAS